MTTFPGQTPTGTGVPRAALVTGGASGIGAAVAARLRADGWCVWTFDRSPAAGDDAQHQVGDVRDGEALRQFADRAAATVGGLDALVACAGVKVRGRIDVVDPTVFTEALEVNLAGAFLAMRAALPHLRARPGSGIVFVSSGSAYGDVEAPAYAAAKGGLEALAASAAATLVPDGVRVNTVVPGFVDTPMAAQATEEVRQAMVSRMVAGRLTGPDDVAAAIAFLCSPDAATISGSFLDVGHPRHEAIRPWPVAAGGVGR